MRSFGFLEELLERLHISIVEGGRNLGYVIEGMRVGRMFIS